jgi:hypothetical protein
MQPANSDGPRIVNVQVGFSYPDSLLHEVFDSALASNVADVWVDLCAEWTC